MDDSADRPDVESELLAFAGALGGAESADVVLSRSLSVLRSLFADSAVTCHVLGAEPGSVTTLKSTDATEAVRRSDDEAVPVSVVRSVIEAGSVKRGDEVLTEVDTGGWETAPTDVFAPVADRGVLRVTLQSADGAAGRTTDRIERVADTDHCGPPPRGLNAVAAQSLPPSGASPNASSRT